MDDSDGSDSPTLSKKLRQSSMSSPSEVEDRISNLPDTVICCILSLLPTKEAVRTSVLSKRWKYQWTTLPNIILNDSPLDSYRKNDQHETQALGFLKFVDGVIFRRDASSLEKFCLSFATPIEQSHVNAWISAVISRKVRELSFVFPSPAEYVFPVSLFAFKTLTSLHLEDCSLKISSNVCFENLKTCRLSFVIFLNEPSTQCVFPNCPMLESLVLDNCYWTKWTTFIINIPSLKSFRLEFDDLFIYTKIYAPKLEDLKLYGCFAWPDWVFCDLHSLANVSIDYIVEGSTGYKKAEQVVRLFKAIQAVRSLQIHDNILEKLSLIECLKLGNNVPTFHNMTHLEVLFDDCFTHGVDLLRILLRSPRLKSLSIDTRIRSDWFWLDDEWMQYYPPLTFKPAIKEVSMTRFQGNVAEIRLLEILLHHSASLERVNIFCDKNMSENSKKREETNHLLQMLPRSSSSCVIQLH